MVVVVKLQGVAEMLRSLQAYPVEISLEYRGVDGG